MTTRAWDARDRLAPRTPLLSRLTRRRATAREPQAVLWDMDGLLVDTEPVWTVAEEELAVRLGGSWSTELKARIVGTHVSSSVPTILSWYDVPATPQAVADTTRWLLGRMVELFGQAVTVQPGAAELLDELARAEIPTALVSSSPRVLVNAVLAQGLGPFAVTVAGDEVSRPKPDAQPYHAACARLDVDPSRAVVLEDSPAGVASAQAAGCAVVAVPSVAGTVIPPGPRQLVVPSLEHLDLPTLRRLVQGRG